MHRESRGFLVLAVGLLIAIAGPGEAKQKRTTKKGSQERLEECETDRKVCQDIGCKHYSRKGETPDEELLIRCYDDCIKEYNTCMNDPRKKGAAGAASKDATGGVERSR
jgi:hypothetical protein